jgi:hypothetical protein
MRKHLFGTDIMNGKVSFRLVNGWTRLPFRFFSPWKTWQSISCSGKSVLDERPQLAHKGRKVGRYFSEF